MVSFKCQLIRFLRCEHYDWSLIIRNRTKRNQRIIKQDYRKWIKLIRDETLKIIFRLGVVENLVEGGVLWNYVNVGTFLFGFLTYSCYHAHFTTTRNLYEVEMILLNWKLINFITKFVFMTLFVQNYQDFIPVFKQ